MASGPITSWQINGETVREFIWGGSKITAVMKLKDLLTPWKKSYDQPRQHIKEQRHYFANRVPLVKAMVFPVVMYGCERVGLERKLNAEELMLLNCGVG